MFENITNYDEAIEYLLSFYEEQLNLVPQEALLQVLGAKYQQLIEHIVAIGIVEDATVICNEENNPPDTILPYFDFYFRVTNNPNIFHIALGDNRTVMERTHCPFKDFSGSELSIDLKNR